MQKGTGTVEYAMKALESLAFLIGISIFAALVMYTPELILETAALAAAKMFGEL